MPHTTVDPVVCAAKIVTELQTIVSRELDPLESGVVSITAITGGSAYNVIPPEVELRGTARSLRVDGMDRLKERVTEITRHVAEAGQCTARVEFPDETYPPTVNDPDSWNLAARLAGEILGADAVVESPPVMGGEDFSYVLQQVPGTFMALGAGKNDGATYGLHHPCLVVDEDALPVGSALHVAFALASLRALTAG